MLPYYVREIDAVCGRLLDHFGSRGARVIVLSEYGITPVSRPVHLNRVLREQGLLAVREELPMTPTGKVLRREVRAELGSR